MKGKQKEDDDDDDDDYEDDDDDNSTDGNGLVLGFGRAVQAACIPAIRQCTTP